MSRRRYDQDVQAEQTPVVIQPEDSIRIMPTPAATYMMSQVKAFQNNLLAALAKQTMDNVTMLVANETRCLSFAPEGAEQYRRIVDEYTDAALALVLRGEQ